MTVTSKLGCWLVVGELIPLPSVKADGEFGATVSCEVKLIACATVSTPEATLTEIVHEPRKSGVPERTPEALSIFRL